MSACATTILPEDKSTAMQATDVYKSDKVIADLQTKADNGDTNAMIQLANIYAMTEYDRLDNDKANLYFERAARSGSMVANASMAFRLYQHQSYKLNKDDALASQYVSRALELYSEKDSKSWNTDEYRKLSDAVMYRGLANLRNTKVITAGTKDFCIALAIDPLNKNAKLALTKVGGTCPK